MSKTVTLRLDEKIYSMFRTLAEKDHRPLSNFIEHATLCFIENNNYVDEYEMTEIIHNNDLSISLKRGIKDAQKRKGRFVE